MKLVAVRGLMLSAALAVALSCRGTDPGAEVASEFAGGDCASAKADLAFQAPKLAEAKQLFEATGAGSLDDIASEADCNAKLLHDAGTDQAGSVHGDAYQKCVDYYKIRALVAAREARLAATDCRQGADLGVVVPVFISTCDTPCQFTSVECGLVELEAKGARRRFACGSTRGATDAATGYCREFKLSPADCKVGDARLLPGRDIAAAEAVLAGGETDALAMNLQTFAAGVASATYNGGVVVSGEARIEFKASGTLTLEMANDNRAARAGEFIASGTEVACKINLTGFVTGSGKAFVGVGGSFKVFGNGVDVQAGAEGGLALQGSVAKSSTLGKVQGGGLEAQTVLERCVPLATAWLTTNVASEFKPFADAFAAHVDEFKAQTAAAAEAGFNALARAEEGLDVKGRIFCDTDADAALNSRTKVYRILKFYASVGAGVITVKVDYDGSLSPLSATSKAFGWAMKGNARGEELLRRIQARGVSSLNDDEIRWLLTSMTYSGDHKFTACERTSF